MFDWLRLVALIVGGFAAFGSQICSQPCHPRASGGLGAKTVTPTVILIGVLKDGGSGFPLCIEPEDGPMVPADFDDLRRRADEFYDRDPERQVQISTAAEWIHERREQQFRDRAYRRAIREVLEAKLQLRFFVGSPTLVNEHFVYTAVGLPTWVLDDTPHLTSEVAAGRYPVTRSLVQGVIDTILRLSTRELRQPYAGADLDIDSADVAKAAAESVIASVSMLAGDVPSGLFDGMNRLATTRYERRVGVGSLLLAEPGSQYVERSVTLRDPVRISETRALRKLLETSSRDGESLLTDGHSIYGLGHLRPDYPQESESVFKLLVTGDGTWELIHAAVTLATVQYGAPQVPQQPLRRDRLIDVCHRVLGEYDIEALCDLADAARKAEHGTMLVISTQAEAETARLESQAFLVQPTRLADNFVEKVTEIDGAFLVDPFGKCHAIGVILDGTATTQGDRSRGARYNSAVKYLASVEARPTVILLVSEDGMINLLPDLPPRIRRGERDAMLGELRIAAEKVPADGEQFYKAYRQIQEHSSYFSPEQIAEINTLMDDHWKRRIAQGGPNTVRVIEPELKHDSNMSDEYLIDD